LYGYPITDAYQDPNGLLIQYFQKARFELHPNAPRGLRVQLSPLGDYMYRQGQYPPIIENSPACRTFPQTGYQICYAFLQFYNANGGKAQFGYPISNIELQNNRRVQYFQKALFEFYPEYSQGERVELADLGYQYFFDHGEDQSRLLPSSPGEETIKGIFNLKVRAFPEQAVTATQGNQTVYIIVQDQRREFVEDAQVRLTIRYPSGEEREILDIEPTNAQGFTRYTFEFETQPVGVVEIAATASHGGHTNKTTTSFRIWW
jgi:hypothetical protein